MFIDAAEFLLRTAFDLIASALFLRFWMQWARVPFHNAFAQFVVKITQPVVGPLRRIIPSLGPVDSASLLLAFLLRMKIFQAVKLGETE